jgi:hypothetical protein
MKYALITIIAVILFSFLNSSVFAGCGGKEWELGRALQVTPTGSTNFKDWPLWKVKLGTCVGDSIVFSKQYYYNVKPTSKELSASFGQSVHDDVWHAIPEKQRTFYVFQSDWNAWHKRLQGRLATISAINFLLTKTPERQPGPGNLAYTPDNPSPTAENESVLTLSQKAWQRMYREGENYVQIQVRADGAKIKFGQRINTDQVKFFDVRYQIPVSIDWYEGITPFILSDMFPGYIFKDEMYPGDEQDIWTARVFIPGYKHIAYTPDKPSPSSEGESNISLSEYSWQNVYPLGSSFCQIQKRSDNTFKVKFGVVRNGYVEIFNVHRNIPVSSGWSEGKAPFNLAIAFPEYHFQGGFDPEGSEVWTARVWIPRYNR